MPKPRGPKKSDAYWIRRWRTAKRVEMFREKATRNAIRRYERSRPRPHGFDNSIIEREFERMVGYDHPEDYQAMLDEQEFEMWASGY